MYSNPKRRTSHQQEYDNLAEYEIVDNPENSDASVRATHAPEAVILDQLNEKQLECVRKAEYRLKQLPKVCFESDLEKVLLYLGLLSDGVSAIKFLGFNVHLDIKKQGALIRRIGNLEKNAHYVYSRGELRAFKEKIKTVLRNVFSGSYQIALNELAAIKNETQPFDIEECIDLINKADEASGKIRKEKILLLLGITGAGKSTLIHYLANTTFEKKVINGVAHFEPSEVKNEHLRDVKTSREMRSETRYLSAVPVQFSDISGDEIDDDNIVICDTPGFEDTGGPEIDIANGVGVYNAVKEAESVLPVILFSEKSIGERGVGLRKILRLLIKMIPANDEYKDEFSYVFTKFKKETLDGLSNEFRRYFSSLTAEEKQDKAYESFLKNLVRATRNGAVGFDPESLNRFDLLTKLTKTHGIKHPEEVFKFSPSETSRGALKEQLNIIDRTVREALNDDNIELVTFKLSLLLRFSKVLKWDQVTKSYAGCVAEVGKMINSISESAVLCSEDHPLNGHDVEKFSNSMERFSKYDQLRAEHPMTKVAVSSSLVQQLEIEFKKREKPIENAVLDRTEPSVSKATRALEEMSLMKSRFSQLNDQYALSESKMFRVLEFLKDGIIEQFRQGPIILVEYAKSLTHFTNVLEALSAFTDVSVWNEIYSDLKLRLKKYLDGNADEIQRITAIDGSQINENLLESLKTLIDQINEFKSAPIVFQHIDSAYFDKCNEAVEGHVSSFFISLIKKINETMAGIPEIAFEKAESELGMARQLFEVRFIASKHSKIYHETFQRICTSLKDHCMNCQRILEDFLDDKDHIDFQKLLRSLMTLRKADWLESYQSGILDNSAKELYAQIERHIDSKVKLFQQKVFPLRDPGRVVDGYDLLARLDLVSILEEVVPGLKTIREGYHAWMRDKVSGHLREIRSIFNLDYERLTQLKIIEEDLNEVCHEYSSKKLSKVGDFLKEHDLNSQDDLRSNISKHKKTLETYEARESELQQFLAKTKGEILRLEKLDREVERLYSKTKRGVANRVLNLIGIEGFKEEDDVGIALFSEREQFERLQREQGQISTCIENIRAVLDKLTNLDQAIAGVTMEARSCLDDRLKEQLSKQGFSSRDELSRELEELFSRIESDTAEDPCAQTRATGSFNPNFSETVSIYIEKCESIVQLSDDKEFKKTKEKYSLYMEKYVETMRSELNTRFKAIMELAADSEVSEYTEFTKQVTENSRHLYNTFKRLQDIKEKYTHLYQKFFQDRNIEHEFIEQVSQYYDQISDEMRRIEAAKLVGHMKPKLAVINALRRFDIETHNMTQFASLYLQFQAKFFDYAHLSPEHYQAVKEHNFMLLRDQINRLTVDDGVGRNNRDQLVDFLKRNLLELMEDIMTGVIMLRDDLDADVEKTITDLKKGLQVLREAESLDIGLESEFIEEIKSFKNDVLGKVKVKFVEFLDRLKLKLRADDFKETSEGLGKIDRLTNLLGAHLRAPELRDKFVNLKKDRTEYINSLASKYKTMPIEEYKNKPPRELYSKLSHGGVDCIPVMEEMRRSIFDNVDSALADALKTGAPPEKNEHIRKVKMAIRFLPEEWKDTLSQNEETIKQEIIDNLTTTSREVTELLQSDDPILLKKYLTSVASREGSKIEGAKELKLMLDKKLTVFDEELSCAFEREDYSRSFFTNLKKLSRYKLIEHDVLSIDSYLSRAQERVSVVLDNAHRGVGNNLIDAYDNEAVSRESAVNVEKHFNTLVQFVRFYKEPTAAEGDDRQESLDTVGKFMLPLDFISKQAITHRKIKAFFKENFGQKFDEALEKRDLEKCSIIITSLAYWKDFLLQVRKYKNEHRNDTKDIFNLAILDKDLEEINYESFKARLTRLLIEATNQIKQVEFASPAFRAEDLDRVEMFRRLNECFYVSSKVSVLQIHIDVEILGIQNIIKKVFKPRLDQFITKAIAIAEKKILIAADFEELNFRLDNLNIMKKELKHVDEIIENFSFNDEIEKIDTIIRCHVIKAGVKIKENLNLDCVEKISEELRYMKRIGLGISYYQVIVDERINSCLNDYKRLTGANGVAKLGVLLNGDIDGIGPMIVNEHGCFTGFAISLFNQRTATHGIDSVLQDLERNNDGIDISRLEKRYREYRKLYDEFVEKELVRLSRSPESGCMEIVNKLKLLVSTRFRLDNRGTQSIELPRSVKDEIPKLLAYLFAIWTVKNASHYFEASDLDDSGSYLIQPHAAQVISVMRLLSVDVNDRELSNHLNQVLTGEGKSVTLAILASVFALIGFEVSCVCYSQYLSDRDYQAFTDFFNALGVTEKIKYGTFNELCETVIKENGDIRDLTIRAIKGEPLNEARCDRGTEPKGRVLLIDEVDVFFSKDFYGSMYSPIARLKDDTIKVLTNLIWQYKDSSDLSFSFVKKGDEYRQCLKAFEQWDFLIDSAVKRMLTDIKDYRSHDYIVKDDRIGYKDQDTVVFNMLDGYKTLFAYYYEHDQGRISERSLLENISLSIQCGHYSYAEIPKLFNCILGVTGTLKSLNPKQKEVIEQSYNIKRCTYVPSVFGSGESRFEFKKRIGVGIDAGIKIQKENDYHVMIKNEIECRLGPDARTKRAVLVFFKDIEKLRSFYNSAACASIKHLCHIISEETEGAARVNLIKQATTSGRITLLTRVFGRGVDFVCYDSTVKHSGGMHVIQTFLSTDISEEVQIQGRTARQGDPGSYSMVILDNSLEYFQITNSMLEEEMEKDKIYEFLDKMRNRFFSAQYVEDTKYVDENRIEHKASMEYISHLTADDKTGASFVRDFIEERNNVKVVSSLCSRTICLLDGTTSMSHLMQKSKNTVKAMFENGSAVLKDHGVSENAFKMQFVIFRNYDCKKEKLLQYSTWESEPDNLRAFMSTIRAEGGTWMPEAIEIGLWHVNQEANEAEVDQVILIGDAPANTPELVARGRKEYKGESYWQSTEKFAEKIYAEDELKTLAERGIPVHAYYVVSSSPTVSFFKHCADVTEGESAFLDVNSEHGAQMLTHKVTEQVLKSVAKHNDSVNADELIDDYRRRFGGRGFL
jgi:energy-coupling factor transporter ATP-binding protein EcfA2